MTSLHNSLITKIVWQDDLLVNEKIPIIDNFIFDTVFMLLKVQQWIILDSS